MAQAVEAISIHAPSQERPDGIYNVQRPEAISIHAPSQERLTIINIVTNGL